MVEVVINIAQEIVANLVPHALEKVGNFWGIKHELKMLEDAVLAARVVLDHVEEQYHQNVKIHFWVERLKEAFLDTQDVLEEFSIETTRQELRRHTGMIKKVRTLFSNSNELFFIWKMNFKVRAMRKRIEAIQADKEFDLEEGPKDLRVEREWKTREDMHSFISKAAIKGRDDDKKKVMKFLFDLEMGEHVTILPIVGVSGLGKTALAQSIYNEEMVNVHFHLKMWVCVSKVFDAKQIVKNVVACAKGGEPTNIPMDRLIRELRAAIDGKRYLLVLDDVWTAERETWQSLKTYLGGGAKGSKILITTRHLSVAENIDNTIPYLLCGIPGNASLDLLLQMACLKEEEIQDPEMLAIGKEIVRKCAGVPLVIRTVGSLLSFKKTTYEWLHFNDHELPEVSQSEDCILFVLRLSYDHLPSHLKQCFTFCSLFPKEYEIKKQTLINLWVAEGFIKPSNGSQDLEDIANRYFMDLLWSNFFQDSQKDSIMNKETYKMPVLMHDLACFATQFECWGPWDDTKHIQKRIRHISHGLTSNLMSEYPISLFRECPLRTFLSTPTNREMEQRKPTSEADLRQLIQNFKRLRILDLHATIVKKVPRSICKLKHLTYLDLSHNNALKRLPKCITRLQNLQTLNLQGCFALEKLPRDIRKLVNLRNLDIDYCYGLSYMPHGLGQLRCLRRLTRFILPKGKALAKNYCGLGGLNGLNDIRGSLSIENLGRSSDALAESKVANLIGKCYLESLIFKWSYLHNDDANIGDKDETLLDGLRPHFNLQKLTIDRYEGKSFPKWMMDSLVSSLPNLVEVRLLRCGRCEHLPPFDQLQNVKSLEIGMLTKLDYFESNHSSTSKASFPSLLRLEIWYCENLKAMPLTPCLEDLIMRKVNRELINQIFGLNKLKSLDISQMEFLECLPECLQSLTSLERLGISECPRLTSFSHGMRHLSNLVHLSFFNCEELDLSKDENDNILDLQGLKSLRFVDILGVPKLASLPQWLLQVSNLERLSIKKCLNLKALPEQIKALQSLQQLEIIRCPLLISLPEGMQSLVSLSRLKIAGCPNLEERCRKETGEDWYKIKRIPHVTHKLEYYERHL